jgi:hypothetical protein
MKNLNSKNLLFLSLLFINSLAHARNLYVATNGHDTINSGSFLSPYRTIQRGLDMAQPGDTILVRAGVYLENLIWNRSGTENAPIVLRNYANENAIIDGTNRLRLSILEIKNQSHVSVIGLTFRNNYQRDACGICVLGEGRRITLNNCTVREIGWGTNPNANPAIDPDRPENAHGILVAGKTATGFSNVKITGCQVYSIITGNSEAVTLVGNVDGFEVSDNQVYETKNIGIIAAGHYTWGGALAAPPPLNQARNGLITRNRVFSNRRFDNYDAPAGIYVDGARSVSVVSNVSYQNGNGLSVGCENPNATADNILIANNVVYDNDNNGLVFGSATGTSQVQSSTVANNTFFRNGFREIYGEINGMEIALQRSQNCLIVNNIVIPRLDTKHGIAIFDYQLSNLTVSHNLLYRYTGNTSNLYVFENPAQYVALNPITVDPQFVNTNLASLNLTLQSTSPAINAGTNAYGVPVATDAAGQSRLVNGTLDLGAYERQDGGCPTVFVVTPAHRLGGKLVASQRIEFNSGVYTLTEPLILKSPRVRLNLAARLQAGTLLKWEQAGCP